MLRRCRIADPVHGCKFTGIGIVIVQVVGVEKIDKERKAIAPPPAQVFGCFDIPHIIPHFRDVVEPIVVPPMPDQRRDVGIGRRYAGILSLAGEQLT